MDTDREERPCEDTVKIQRQTDTWGEGRWPCNDGSEAGEMQVQDKDAQDCCQHLKLEEEGEFYPTSLRVSTVMLIPLTSRTVNEFLIY